jgi:hypothetical protein
VFIRRGQPGTVLVVHDETLTFLAGPAESQEIEIRVNFGVFAGREATDAEIDDLAGDLLHVVRRASVVAVRRHELEEGSEAAVNQVKISVDPEEALEPADRDALAERLLALIDAWARRCIELRHADVTDEALR